MFKQTYRHEFHIMPPKGWLNDPNGLCYYEGWYHVFFQYSPDQVHGGLKVWGHYRSRDMLCWEFCGIPVPADTPYDRHGAYSGTAFTADGQLELFYTGNVKLAGDYDYILQGRNANVLTLSSADGLHFGEKKCLLTNEDYPQECSGHVRDPKVWKEKGSYYMLLGARSRQEEGFLLLYTSEDKKRWEFAHKVQPDQPFGYMWECPDTFCIEGRRVLMCCPQGLAHEKLRFQNVYQAGYFIGGDGTLEQQVSASQFTEWDMGFDFYAPQTFLDASGERILIGWAGLPDAPYGNDGAVAEGWQHSMTCLRKISLADGKLRQCPIDGLKKLRGEEAVFSNARCITESRCFDMEIFFSNGETGSGFRIGEDLEFVFADQTVCLRFLNQTGNGRTCRNAALQQLENVRVLFDHSLLEVFVNDGELAFTTRYYPKQEGTLDIRISGGFQEAHLWDMKRRG